MKLKFNPESTKRIVENYYKKYQDFDCKLETKCSVVPMKNGPRSFTYTNVPHLSFSLEGKLNINGNEEVVSTPISLDDVRNAFKTMLEDEGYSVKNVSFDFDESENGRGKGQFNGTVVEMSTKRKIKK